MRVFPPGQHQRRHRRGTTDDPEPEQQLWSRKSRRLAKKMAKLEQKLCKYSAVAGECHTSSRDSSRCRGGRQKERRRSRSGRRAHRRHRGHGRRFASHGGSSSSDDDDDSSSDSGDSSAASSPERSDDAGSSSGGSRSPSPARRDQRHRHGRRRHRWSCEGVQAAIYRLLSQSEPSAPAAAEEATESERFLDAENRAEEHDVQEVAVTSDEAVAEESAIDASLASRWKKLIVEGLPSEAKTALFKRYALGESRQILKAPRLNAEIYLVATETAIKNDCILVCEQNQIGSGLSALSQAMARLRAATDGKEPVHSEVLEKLGDAADMLLNAHRDLSKARKLILVPELRRGARAACDGCQPDEYLFGRDFAEKVKDSRYFKGDKRLAKARSKAEGKREAGKKRKHGHHHEAGRRGSKRLDLSGLSIKSS